MKSYSNCPRRQIANIFNFLAIAFDALAGYTFARVSQDHGRIDPLSAIPRASLSIYEPINADHA